MDPLVSVNLTDWSITIAFMLAERRPVNPHIHYMKQLKHRYCCCRPLVVAFVYYALTSINEKWVSEGWSCASWGSSPQGTATVAGLV